VLESSFNLLAAEASRRKCSIYFVSAWQMYLAIDAIRQHRDPVAAAQTRQHEAVSVTSERKQC
jgi:hypothetical protein